MDEIKRHFDEKANEMVEAAETRVMTLCAANTAMALENKQRVIESTKQTRFAELANRHNSNARAKILIILNVNKVDKNEQGEVLDDQSAALAYINNAIKENPIGFTLTTAYFEKVTRTKFITFQNPRPNAKEPLYPEKDKLKITFVHESFRNLVYNAARLGGHRTFIRDMSQMDRYYFDHIYFAVDQLNADPNGTHWYTIADNTVKTTRARNPGEQRKDPPAHRKQPRHPGKLSYEFPSVVAKHFGAGADDEPVDEEMQELMDIPIEKYVQGPAADQGHGSRRPHSQQQPPPVRPQQRPPPQHQAPPQHSPRGTVQNNIYMPRASNPTARFPNINPQQNQSYVFQPQPHYGLGATPCARGGLGVQPRQIGVQLAIQNMQRLQNMSTNNLVSPSPHTSTPMPSKFEHKRPPSSLIKKTPKRSSSNKRRTSPIESPLAKKEHIQPSIIINENSENSEISSDDEHDEDTETTPVNVPAKDPSVVVVDDELKETDESDGSFDTAEGEDEDEHNDTVKRKVQADYDEKAIESARKKPMPMEGEGCIDFEKCYDVILEKHKLFAEEDDKERILKEMSSDVQILHFLANTHKDGKNKEKSEWVQKCLKEVLGLVSINFQSLELTTILSFNYMEIEEKCIAILEKKALPLVTSVLPTEQLSMKNRRDYLFKKNAMRAKINQNLESSIL